MDRSLLSSTLPSRNGSPSTSRRVNEPRWLAASSSMTASIIPPPIVNSIYQSSTSASNTYSPSIVLEASSISTPIQDRQIELQAELQYLLDAQAEGLLHGLEGGAPDGDSSTGSMTPTIRSTDSTALGRTRRSTRKKPALRSARKGIFSAMLALSAVKEDQLGELDETSRKHSQRLHKIEVWDTKRRRLQDAVSTIEENEDTARVQRLRGNADLLQEEISVVELQLADMKSRHRKLLKQAAAVENSVQAKLASYTTSMRMLEEDVQSFLASESQDVRSAQRATEQKSSMWQLPPKRRTLEMARQHCSDQRNSTVEQRQSIEHEKLALEEGAVLWKDVVTQVGAFEQHLRSEMPNLSSPALPETTTNTSSADRSQKLQETVTRMTSLLATLDKQLQQAKDRNWNLLVAAIGAELDALQQGQQILQSLLQPDSQQPNEPLGVSGPSTPGSADELNELDKSFSTSQRRVSHDTESDDPDPELLFSKHDTDGE